jgi:tRNA-guanine family transglycosylase
MILELQRHSGPARLGRLLYEGREILTPNFFSIATPRICLEHDLYLGSDAFDMDKKPQVVDYTNHDIDKFGIMPDMHVGLDVPREMAEFSVEETLRFAGSYPDQGAVIQGSRFIDLRKKCAEGLKDRPLLAIANGRKLIENPRLATEIVTGVRDIIAPNSALYFPSAPPRAFYMLAYMGVDLFDSADCVFKAREGKIITSRGDLDLQGMREIPCSCCVCRGKSPRELIEDFEALLNHNFNFTLQAVKEIREAIRDNSFRELVEGKAATDVNLMAMLRILDKEKQDFLEKYTPV